ncbi:hypothetical protein M2169_000248 [Streptomyces sp. MJP52]|nr:hypothetical protein [Streptomyces sp. MJP52]
MALSQSDLLRLLESLRSADGLELVREVAERLLQELIEAEASAKIGAEWGEHSDTRTTWRNGHREKTVTTQAGDLELAIPKLRAGSFFPSLLERRRRIDQALYAVVMEAYVHRVSTRSVDDLVKALGSDTGISKSEVSRICADLDEQLEAFRSRPLDHIRFPYLFLDATYVKARVGHRIVSQAIVIATGVTEDGCREVVGVQTGVNDGDDAGAEVADAVDPAESDELVPCQQLRACVLEAGRVQHFELPHPLIVQRRRWDRRWFVTSSLAKNKETTPSEKMRAVHQEWAATCTPRLDGGEERARLRVVAASGCACPDVGMRMESEGSQKFRLWIRSRRNGLSKLLRGSAPRRNGS